MIFRMSIGGSNPICPVCGYSGNVVPLNHFLPGNPAAQGKYYCMRCGKIFTLKESYTYLDALYEVMLSNSELIPSGNIDKRVSTSRFELHVAKT